MWFQATELDMGLRSQSYLREGLCSANLCSLYPIIALSIVASQENFAPLVVTSLWLFLDQVVWAYLDLAWGSQAPLQSMTSGLSAGQARSAADSYDLNEDEQANYLQTLEEEDSLVPGGELWGPSILPSKIS